MFLYLVAFLSLYSLEGYKMSDQLTDQLTEVYETNDGKYRLPLYLEKQFKELGFTYRLAGNTPIGGAGPYTFRADDGISGTVSSKDVVNQGGMHGLILEIDTANPRTETQEQAVNRLLLKLPMFEKVVEKSAK